MRRSIPAPKRLAVGLHWLAHGTSFAQLATLYALAKSTVVSIVHDTIDILREKLVPKAIVFPSGSKLDQVMVDFESLCGLPFCGGAIDGTFVPIKKPEDFGDTYYCYNKQFELKTRGGCRPTHSNYLLGYVTLILCHARIRSIASFQYNI